MKNYLKMETVRPKNNIHPDDTDAAMEREADVIAAHIRDNEPLYKDDPAGDVLVDDDPAAANGMFGDHEDDFDIG